MRDFKNFIEPWEHSAIANESLVNEKQLEQKYKGVCFYDEEDNSVYRVIGVEWRGRERSTPAHYQVVSIKLENATNPHPDKRWGYFINELLKDLINECSKEYNNAFNMVLN